MWYDDVRQYGHPDDPDRKALNQTFLEGLAKILSLSNLACKEAALHGLGHWNHHYPDQVVAIIDKFLVDNPVSTPNITAELRAYALNAWPGM